MGKRGPGKNLELRKQVKSLKRKGLNVRQIALHLGLSTQRVYVLLKDSEPQADRGAA